MDLNRFYNGDSFDAYGFFGAHMRDGAACFRLYAPRAKAVNIMGEFSTWQEQPMALVNGGVWEYSCPWAYSGQMYKYVVYSENGRQEHCDPYGFGMEMRPGNCSVIRKLDDYHFSDGEWMHKRTKCFDAPLNIYEMHLGSWRKKGWQWYEYDELADELIAYIKENNYTHVEFMPLAEHPFDGSWGYQGTGYFAATSRYGSPAQLMALIDRLHNAGIGAILDFVPVHFALDGYGLRELDGKALYEYPGRKGRSEWGSLLFDHGRGEVRSFLKSAANYWLREYHFDGLRIDAVSRLIFNRGDWQKGENSEGLRFIKELNQGLARLNPTAMLIAEDSTAYPGLTKPVEQGGLGFDYKWDLGWTYNTLQYLSLASGSRGKSGERISAALDYSHSERFILPLSHDENNRHSATVFNRLHGKNEQTLPQARLLQLYMLCHPGKKLRFMGTELAQAEAWDEGRALDWWILSQSGQAAYHSFVRDINALYIKHKALWAEEKFQWLNCRSSNPCVFGFSRPMGEETLLVFLNFSNKAALMEPEVYGDFTMLIHSDWDCYGGGTKKAARRHIMKRLPAHSAVVYKCRK